MKTTIRVKRFNSEAEPTGDVYSEYTVEVEDNMRVIDALETLARNEDPTLTFRRSCVHGVCGSDAMRINGKERLACKTLFRDVSHEQNGYVVVIEPLRNFEIKKDLLVDQEPFFAKYKSISPYLIPVTEQKEEKESPQSPEQLAMIDEAAACIGCGACYSACSVLQKNPQYIGPMALVQAARFLYDSRDQGLAPRLEVLDQPNGVWACENLFECTKVCPRGIKITKLINMTKRKIQDYKANS